ncbi:xylose reductase [Gilbertella persicaria]|uniref:NAD(P)H-dependent D-xylose reductase (XR) n=1 Tax=Rhizopus stolonifer TaxID=4846 RepID=A0A367JH97_RHIST|nr:xylose reductase [Gilbertella persicaria]KAI8059431.1 xylose reductase [Gilbertella persicaria]RCH89328.1 NAD(P)H-dependent D-xylose reductase (XR) [Rhizopus stolonifer]
MASETHLTLNRTNDKMPIVGFGCWKVSNEDAEDTIYNAIKTGYRLFDGAADYGNEVEVGRGINKAIKEGIVSRKDLFVVTKLWNTYHSKDKVRAAFDKQLNDLGLEYVDLYLIHFPVPLKFVEFDKAYPPGWYQPGKDAIEFEASPIHETWREMEKLVEANLARNIGISNFNVQSILDLLTYAKIKPAVLQIELHPYLPQERLVKWVQSQGIQVTAYSSFGPTSYVDLHENGKKIAPLLEHDTIKAIADKHKVSTGQVLLRWAINRKLAVIPKSVNQQRLKGNLEIFSIKLDGDDNKALDSLKTNQRFNDPMLYGFNLPLFD